MQMNVGFFLFLVTLSVGGENMDKKSKKLDEKINVELGGMGLYGTTSDQEIAGYQATGDIENAGRLDKGFKKEEGHRGSTASYVGKDQRD
jgi:hypothetical protein